MKVVEYRDVEVGKTPHNVDVRKLYDNEHVQVVHIELKPGEALLKHITPVDVFFYVLEGVGMVEVGDDISEVRKDMLVESPKKIPHRLWNDGEGIFRFLVVKTPRPSNPARML